MKQAIIRPGEIVQISPECTTNQMFAGTLLVVSEVYNWGVQGYVQSLGGDEKRGGQAWIRVKWDEIEPTYGSAPWVVEGIDV